MYNELELWKAIAKINEILNTIYPSENTDCGEDFREVDCRQLNKNYYAVCGQYNICLARQKISQLCSIIDKHISALEAEGKGEEM